MQVSEQVLRRAFPNLKAQLLLAQRAIAREASLLHGMQRSGDIVANGVECRDSVLRTYGTASVSPAPHVRVLPDIGSQEVPIACLMEVAHGSLASLIQ